jgi:hypothetical protein
MDSDLYAITYLRKMLMDQDTVEFKFVPTTFQLLHS